MPVQLAGNGPQELIDLITEAFSAETTPVLSSIPERARGVGHLGLGGLQGLLQELQSIEREAKKRGEFLARELQSQHVSRRSSLTKDKATAKALSQIRQAKVATTEPTIKQLGLAIQIEKDLPLRSRPRKSTLEDILEDSDDSEDLRKERQQKKKKAAKNQYTPKALWAHWESFWQYPTLEALHRYAKPLKVPPFASRKDADSAFATPDVGPHYSFNAHERENFRKKRRIAASGGGRTNSKLAPEASARSQGLHQRLVCALTDASGTDSSATPPGMSDEVRTVLLRKGIFTEKATEKSAAGEGSAAARPTAPPRPKLRQLGSRSCSGSAFEERIIEELADIGVLSKKDPTWAVRLARCDSEVHVTLRDRQIKLLRQLRKNNKSRWQLIREISRRGVPLNTEKALSRSREVDAELLKVYSKMKKKGYEPYDSKSKKKTDPSHVFADFLPSIERAVNAITTLRRDRATRRDLTGYTANPEDVDNIPRSVLPTMMADYERRRAEFKASHAPLELTEVVPEGLYPNRKSASSDPDPPTTPIRSFVNRRSNPKEQYLDAQTIFAKPAPIDAADTVSDGESNESNGSEAGARKRPRASGNPFGASGQGAPMDFALVN